MPDAETTSTSIASSHADGACLAAEQVSLEVKYHEREYADRIGDTSVWFWGSFLISSGGLVVMWIQLLNWTKTDLVLVFYLGLLGVAYGWRRIGKRVRIGIEQRPSGLRQDARLQATGRTDELSCLENLPDVAFEPVIVQRAFSSARMATEGIVNASYVGLFGYLLLSKPINGMEEIILGMIFLVLLSFSVSEWLRPAYYRISPRKLEVLRRSVVSQRIWVQDHYDLRRARMAVRFDKGEATVNVSGREPLEIQLASLSEPRAFIRGLCLAAVCTHPAPPLPDDALLG